MEASQFLPVGELQPHNFSVWGVETDDFLFKHMGQKIVEHQVAINGAHRGMLHLELHGNDQEALIGGIDPPEGEDEVLLSDGEWEALAIRIYMDGITKARLIEHPGGKKTFLESV
jgi:hypothetical protein